VAEPIAVTTPRFLGGYAALLARPGVIRLVAAGAVARLPTAMLPLAILLLVVESSGSLAAAGLVTGAFGLGRALVSPAVGTLIDRVGQPRVLIGGSIVQAALLMALVGAAGLRLNPLLVGAAATAAGSASPPVQASLRALWPMITLPAQRDAAYSFDATSQELIWIIGPLLVAAILGVGTPSAAVIGSAVLGCAGVGLFATSQASRDSPRSAAGSFLPSALGTPGLPALVGAGVCGGFAYGALSFGLSALAVQLGQRQAAGLLLAALSAGSIAGGLAYGAWSWRTEVIDRFRALLIACAALAAPLLFVGSIALGLPAALLAGLPLAPMYGASYVLTGRVAPRQATTEAFTWTSSAFALGVSLGTGASGIVTQSAGVHAAFALACLAPLAAWFLAPLIGDRRALAESPQAG
jgi:MFS family permease